MADTQLIGIPIEDLQEADSSNLTDSTKVIVEDDGTPVTRQCNLGVMADWVNDRVVIGGRNLLPNTKDMSGYTGASNVTFTEDTEGFMVGTFSAVEELAWNAINVFPAIQFSEVRGKTVTFSFLVRSDEYASINAEGKQGIMVVFALCTATSTTRTLYGGKNFYYVDLSDEWKKLSITVTLTDDFFASGSGTIDDDSRFYIQLYNYSMYSSQVKKFMLELGNKATDWCLSDKDMVSSEILTGEDVAYATMSSAFSTGSDDNAKLKVVREGAFCLLTGRIVISSTPTANDIIATIPAEYAPPMHHRFPLIIYGTSYISVGIDSDGTIKYLGSNVSDPTGTTYGTAYWLCKSYD